MKNKHFLIAFLFLFGFILISKNLAKKNSEVDVVESSKKSCISATNEVFGGTVDSVKTCDCLIPGFYNLIKSDSAELEKFKETGIRELSKSNQAKFSLLYKNCILGNIIDTNGTINMNSAIKKQFKNKLKDSILSRFGYLIEAKFDTICNCIVEKLNNHITVKEYLTDKYTKEDKMYRIILDCVNSNK